MIFAVMCQLMIRSITVGLMSTNIGRRGMQYSLISISNLSNPCAVMEMDTSTMTFSSLNKKTDMSGGDVLNVEEISCKNMKCMMLKVVKNKYIELYVARVFN